MRFRLRHLFHMIFVAALSVDIGMRFYRALQYNSADNDNDRQNEAQWAITLLPCELLIFVLVTSSFWTSLRGRRTQV